MFCRCFLLSRPSLSLRSPKPKPKIIFQRSFRDVNEDKLREDANKIIWDELFESNCIDEKVEIFNTKLICLFDQYTPIRKIKVKHLPAPWLTNEIKDLLSKKAKAKSKLKSRPSDRNKEKYVIIRNHCNKVCRNAQRRHIHSSVENGDPTKVWKFLKSLGVGKVQKVTTLKNLDLDLLNQFFSTSSKFDKSTKESTLKFLSSVSTPDCPAFSFAQFTSSDVKRSIMSITSNAVGYDEVSRNMILPILNEILPIICHLLNYSISCGVFPSIWKNAKIIPLPKKNNPSYFSEYRPISILPFLSKVLERLVHTQLNNFLSKNLLLNPLQSGFRPGHSTTTTLVHITEDIRSSMDNGRLTVMALLDFSNAFNTVDFDVLLGILKSR